VAQPVVLMKLPNTVQALCAAFTASEAYGLFMQDARMQALNVVTSTKRATENGTPNPFDSVHGGTDSLQPRKGSCEEVEACLTSSAGKTTGMPFTRFTARMPFANEQEILAANAWTSYKQTQASESRATKRFL
jgi:hypothetical protein